MFNYKQLVTYGIWNKTYNKIIFVKKIMKEYFNNIRESDVDIILNFIYFTIVFLVLDYIFRSFIKMVKTSEYISCLIFFSIIFSMIYVFVYVYNEHIIISTNKDFLDFYQNEIFNFLIADLIIVLMFYILVIRFLSILIS